MNDTKEEVKHTSKPLDSEVGQGGGQIVAQKANKNVEMSYLMSPKTSLGDRDLERILGSNFSNVKDMIESGKNEFLEIGEIYHEKSMVKNNYVITVKSNKGHALTFKLGDYMGKTILDVKQSLFAKEYTEGMTVRFILNGRLLNDKDELSKMKLDHKTFFQAFISPGQGGQTQSQPQQQTPETEALKNDNERPTNIADALNGQRGFDYFKINGYTDQEIVWKRYIFHSEFILTMPLALINDDQLFLKEEVGKIQ